MSAFTTSLSEISLAIFVDFIELDKSEFLISQGLEQEGSGRQAEGSQVGLIAFIIKRE